MMSPTRNSETTADNAKTSRKTPSRSTLNEAEIRHVLNLARDGTPTSELCARYGFSLAEFFRWKARFMEPERNEASDELSTLRRENALLRDLVANLLSSNRSAARAGRSQSVTRPQGPAVSNKSGYRIQFGETDKEAD